ncbi:MAG: hypothetical protein ABSC08_01440 [Bryobacteraceae bacterium]
MPGSDTRRTFLQRSLILGAALWPLEGANRSRIKVSASAPPTLAECEMLRGLLSLHLPAEVRFENAGEVSAPSDWRIVLRIDKAGLPHEESYEIRASGSDVILRAATPRALLFAVYEFLERQGAVFGIDGENYPPEPARELVVPANGQSWLGDPRFSVRGLLPWPDFLNCITIYNEEDFRAYFESMLRMRMNTFGMHVYTQGEQWAESYLSFEYAGAGHLAYLDTTASNRWGYLPQRTSRYGMGSADYFDGEVFGSDATRLGRDPWEIAERTRTMLRRSLSHAKKLGLRTGVGFEPYQIPDETYRALPPEARSADPRRRPRFDPSSYTGRKLLETRLDQLLTAYPDVDHVWLWEDEGANWDSRKEGIPLPTAAFNLAHDFLRRHAPAKRLVISGWGGVARHFADLHKVLPEDIVFSCLSDTLGWDPVHEVFGQLGSRERWPIPWLEDDPSMWLAQFHVNRFKRDVDLAASYGCQGMLGIHWRHRIVDPTATFFARAMWDKGYEPAAHYAAYARSQASGDRARRYGEILAAVDKEQKLLRTGTAEVKDGHVVTNEFSGDYAEGFQYWNSTHVSPAVRASQQQVAADLRALTNSAPPVEQDRLEHVTRHVEFMAIYAEVWILAQALQEVLQRAQALLEAKQPAEARSLVEKEGLPIWLQLAPEVRQAILRFHGAVATRNDLGTLASLQNKFVRLALRRLPLSMAEFLDQMPAAVEQSVADAIGPPDTETPLRLIVPVRPTMLARGEKVRLLAIVPAVGDLSGVVLRTRAGSAEWTERPFKLLGRKTWEAWLEYPAAPTPLLEYAVAARIRGQLLHAPVQGAYRLTILS